jgi:serine/threonine protein kinase
MDRMTGNVRKLIRQGIFLKNAKGQPEVQVEMLRDFMQQILSALDLLAACNYVHRDIKPENILRNQDADGRYHYALGDFGLCNAVPNADTFCGTEMYMAPEIADGRAQSSKSDIYSLFATFADMLGLIDHSRRLGSGARHRRRMVQAARSDYNLLPIAAMADLNPDNRPSAAQLLDQHWEDRGRTLQPPSYAAVPAPMRSQDIAIVGTADDLHTKPMDRRIGMPRIYAR